MTLRQPQQKPGSRAPRGRFLTLRSICGAHRPRAGGGHGSSTARPPSAGETSTRPSPAAAGAHRLRAG
eukprot:6282853-Prymnesium_polylepis.1